MSPNHLFYRQTGDGFEETRRIFVYNFSPVEPNSEEPKMELAETDRHRTPDVVTILNNPKNAESVPDEQLPTAFDQLWNASNQNTFDKQRAATSAYQTELQSSPNRKDMPQFAAVDLVKNAPAEHAATMTDFSLEQTRYFRAMYGECEFSDAEVQQASLSDSPDAEMQTPITEKIAQIRVSEQLKKINTLAEVNGIKVTKEDWESIDATLAKGGTIVADIQGTPVVCGAGTGAGVNSDIFVLSQSQQGNRLLPGNGEGGGNDGKSAKKATLSEADTPSSAQDEQSKQDAGIYRPSASMKLLGDGFMNVEFEGPGVRINTANEQGEQFTIRTKAAVMAASSVPLHPPAKERLTKANKTIEVGNYTSNERALIAGLSRDKTVASHLSQMNGFVEHTEGARDLLAMRFTPETENILTLDDDFGRPREFFLAIQKALKSNGDLRKIAEQNFKRQLLTMKPRNEEEKEFEDDKNRLDMMQCLGDPQQMLDIVSAHLRGELPLYACKEQLTDRRAKDKKAPGLRDA